MNAGVLLCAVCLMTEQDPADADTVVNGYAVCADHMVYVQDPVLAAAVHSADRQARRAAAARS